MEKYRVKIKNGKIVGPLREGQLGELYIKGILSGIEACQQLPDGRWMEIQEFPKLNLLFENIAGGKISLEDLKDERLSKKTNDQDGTSNEETVQVSMSELPVIEEDPSPPLPKEFPIVRPEIQTEKTIIAKTDVLVKEIDLDKTVINKKLDAHKTSETIKSNIIDEEMRVIAPVSSVDDDENKEQEKHLAELEEKKKNTIDSHAKTQLFQLERIDKNDDKEAELSEATRLIKLEEALEKDRGEDQLENKVVEPLVPEILNPVQKLKKILFTSKKGTKTKPIVLIALVAVIFYILTAEDETDKKINIIDPRISFPQVFEVADPEKATEFYQKGLEEYSKSTYVSRVKAGIFFKKSLEYNFKENKALDKIILAYSETLFNSTHKVKDAQVIFKLVRIAESKILKDINITLGTANFYFALNKFHAGINIIENYLRVGRPSIKLLAYYLYGLTEAGELSKAKKVLDKLAPIKNKSDDVYYAMGNFYFNDYNYVAAKKIVEQGSEKYKKSVRLLLQLCKISVYQNDFPRLTAILQVIKILGAENSRIYYAKYLEYKGVLFAVEKKNEKASLFFKKALKINESDELRSKLASLELGGKKRTQGLILESKVIDLMRKAKRSMKEENWERAFTYALEATDLFPTYVPAKILLSEIQVAQGFFSEAIKTLAALVEDNPLSEDAQFGLINAYISAYKFDDAGKNLTAIAQSKLGDSYRFSLAFAEMNLKKDEYFKAAKWFEKAKSKNPVDDQILFKLSDLYIRLRRFKQGKKYLINAIALDPSNIDYRIKYASILYELEDTSTAIGYLRDVLEKYPDNPKVLADIAIYYYRSGQTKFFEIYKKKLEENVNRGKTLYVFLMKKAELDDNMEKVIEYAHEIIKVDPSDLDIKIKLGTILIGRKQFKQAELIFEDIKSRLATYPKLGFYFANIKFKMGEYDKAIELAKQEIENNPNLEHGHILLGDIYRAKNDFRNSEENYKRARLINAKSVKALVGLAWINYKKNHADSALDLYRKASSLAPNDGSIRKELGLVYKALGQGALAVEEFKVYLELNPDAPDRKNIEAMISAMQ